MVSGGLEDEDSEDGIAEYEQIYENEDCTESDSCASSTERKARQQQHHHQQQQHHLHQSSYYKMNNNKIVNKKTKKKKVAIPVQTPRVPMFGSYVSPPEIPLHYQRTIAAVTDKSKL